MKRIEEHNVENDLDTTGRYEQMFRDVVYGEDVAILWHSKQDRRRRRRRRRTVDDIEPAVDNTTMKQDHRHIYTPTGSGIAGGSYYDHPGAAVNTLCLPHEPIRGTLTDGLENYAFVYGAEYHDQILFKRTNVKALSSYNVPCAFCRSTLRTSTFMLPARNRCFGEWHMEYHGYLMTGHHTHKASPDYIYVDNAPEADSSGFQTEYYVLLNRVEAICGSLPCPPYMHGRELICAICSKNMHIFFFYDLLKTAS
ncbi:hypothetical protein CHS0354_015202 [Potamilus streckersoni]|uniref:Uncharacterized protein n=1 Tax=Potamilus streckersoni TaxID=2493646 RepID=A0AAE0VT58_9BIVA|nr:hypothetical protein CHS0354_015202 [Potamilus streckersoni]